MKIGNIDIKKAYWGYTELTPNNAFVGLVPVIEGGAEWTYEGLTFEALQDNSSIAMNHFGTNASTTKPNISYTLDSGNSWTDWDGTSVTLAKAGDKIGFRASKMSTSAANYSSFAMSGRIAASGNIMSLVDNGLSRSVTIPANYYFYKLFNACTVLTQAPALPATTLKQHAYRQMFYDCTALTQAPELPAKSLQSYCYYSMFYRCTSLTTAPVLQATTLASSCYETMFQYCSALKTAPVTLPAKTLQSSCYNAMFKECTALTQAPDIQATTLASNCCREMFYGCSSLTTAPALPATTLANNCYYSMFYNCTSLTQAPALSATTLYNGCYYQMFYRCLKLTTAPVLPATTLIDNCYNAMFFNCVALTQAPELPALDLAYRCYHQMFYNTSTKINYIKSLFVTDITTTTQYTLNWLYGTASTGIFVKNINAEWDYIGQSGVPAGWTIIYFDPSENKYYTSQDKSQECDDHGNPI